MRPPPPCERPPSLPPPHSRVARGHVFAPIVWSTLIVRYVEVRRRDQGHLLLSGQNGTLDLGEFSEGSGFREANVSSLQRDEVLAFPENGPEAPGDRPTNPVDVPTPL